MLRTSLVGLFFLSRCATPRSVHPSIRRQRQQCLRVSSIPRGCRNRGLRFRGYPFGPELSLLTMGVWFRGCRVVARSCRIPPLLQKTLGPYFGATFLASDHPSSSIFSFCLYSPVTLALDGDPGTGPELGGVLKPDSLTEFGVRPYARLTTSPTLVEALAQRFVWLGEKDTRPRVIQARRIGGPGRGYVEGLF